MRTNAIISPCQIYRWWLDRIWYDEGPIDVWIMLNPSTADGTDNDPSVNRCIGFSRAWGAGGIRIVNLYAYRSTDPRQLRRVIGPIGDDNDSYLLTAALGAERVICAWGVNAESWRANQVIEMLRPHVPLWCLGKTKDGMPKHPLYLAAETELIRM